jgi:DNA polymerase-3 subunit epsilon
MKPNFKYWLFIVGIAFAIFTVIGFSFIASWGNLDIAERDFVESIISKLIPYPVFGGLIIFVIVGGMVSLLFRFYIIPILQLSEETRLISSVNAGHRIEPRGASEIQQLIGIINESAEAYEKLQTEVESKITDSKTALDAERNRLAALMSELPSGVIVCNTDGQILLYNPQAQKFLVPEKADSSKAKPIGLGRSIFAIVERNPILHGLDVLQQAINIGKQDPVTGFMLPLGDCFLRFNMAPVCERNDDAKLMTGFVLTIEDIAPEIESDNRMESWLQNLIDDMEKSLVQVRDAITTILGNPEIGANELATHRQTIDSESLTIKKRLDRTREEAARNIHTASRREEVLGGHFVSILCKHLEDRFKIKSTLNVMDDAWLSLDSYMAVQGIAFLAGRLKKRSHIENLEIEMSKEGKSLSLSLRWDKEKVKADDVESWQRTPLITDRFQHTFSFRDFIARHEGHIVLHRETGFCDGITFLLPISHMQEEFSGSTDFEQRPIFYEFDLFASRGLKSLGVIPLKALTYVPFDLETTGLDPSGGDEIIQLGAIRVVNGRVQNHETIDQLVDPQRDVPPIATEITGITPEMLVGQPTVKDVLPEFKEFVEHAVLVAHNAAFDMRFLELNEIRTRVRFGNPVLDTLLLSTVVHPNLDDHTLDGIAGRMNIPIVGRHTALGDAIVTAEILLKLIPLLESQGIVTLADAIKASAKSKFAQHAF